MPKNKHIRAFIIYLILALTAAVIYSRLSGYQKQAAGMVSVILYFLSVRALNKYFNSRWKAYVSSFFKAIGNFLYKSFEKVIVAVKKALRINPNRAYIKGQDQRSIEITDNPFSKLFSKRKRPKYKDLTTPEEKLRFIFLKTLLRIYKKGYRIKNTDTPRELEEIAPEILKKPAEELNLLFCNYEMVRYKNEKTTNKTVEELRRISK